jgi:hypothetical protein
MTASNVEMTAIASRRLSIILDELEEELQNTLKLLTQLKIEKLTQDQRESILGELSTAVLHLHEHTRGLEELIMEEPAMPGNHGN